ncbi:MAG: hypothetical protein QOD12_3063 [Verrucomicrobiota bacterium]
MVPNERDLETALILPGNRNFFGKGAFLLPAIAGALLCSAIPHECILAAEPVAEAADSKPDPIKALATELANAANDAEREALLKKAPPEWIADHSLRKQLGVIEFQRTIEGDYLTAESLGRFVVQFAARHHDAEGVAIAQTQLAAALREFGEDDEALALLHQALLYFEKNPGDSTGLVRTCQALGVVYLYHADFSRALVFLDRALTTAKKIGYTAGIIPSLNSMGEVYRSQGQPERALRFYQEARGMVGDDTAWNMAFLFNNIGQCYEAMGDTEKAIDYIGRARAVAEKVKFRPRVATSLAVLGNLHLRRGELDEAQKCYFESLSLSVGLRDKVGEARGLLGVAGVARLKGDLEEALQPAEHAATLYRAMRDRAGVAAAQTIKGRCLRGLGRSDDARMALVDAITQIEQMRGQLTGGADEAKSFFAKAVAPYHEIVAMLVAENRPEEALVMAERASARVLLDTLFAGKNESRPLSDGERAQRHQLNRRLVELNQSLSQARGSEKANEKRISDLEADVARARDDRENFEAHLDASQSDSERKQLITETPSPAEMAQLVSGGRTALLKFVVRDDQTLVFVVHEDNEPGSSNGKKSARIDVFPLAVKRDELAKRAGEFRKNLAERALDWRKPAHQLYEALLKPSEAAWIGAGHLIIVPDGPLWELPFQALHADDRSLIEKRTVSYAPSISFLARASNKPRSDSLRSARLLALGNPALAGSEHKSLSKNRAQNSATLMGADWQPLPAAEKQVSELRKIYTTERSSIFVGTAAREEVFKREAGKFDILHFATHGVLNDQAPLYSYLLLSQANLSADEDGMLEGYELMRMKLRARLAVLSACETARGEITAGEGITGLSWALFLAGCPTTVVSQWKVESESNTVLMVDFHRRLRDGVAPAEALRQASLALARQPGYHHPFYWAPFVVVGAGSDKL